MRGGCNSGFYKGLEDPLATMSHEFECLPGAGE